VTYTPIPKGTDSWDVPVNAAFVDQDTRITANTASITSNSANIATLQTQSAQVRNASWLPSDYGLISWSMDPSQGANSQVLTSGTLVMIGFKVRSAASLTNVNIVVSTAGAALTVGQNLVGVYDSAGTLVAQSASQEANWTSTGHKQIAMIGGPYPLAAGTYYVAILSNGGTPISIPRETSLSSNIVNLNLSVANARSANLAGQTTLPASITPGSRAFDMNSYWAAIS